MDYAIAVVDIGKTNKKLLVYDQDYTVLDSQTRGFPTVERDGVEYEDVEGIEAWMLEQLAAVSGRFPIRVVSVTTHGATCVCVGEDGKPSIPCISYTNEPGDAFHEEFYRTVGDPNELQRVTATARFGALTNLAQGVFYAQRQFPEGWRNTEWVLNYPQYFGFRLTGNVGAEYTYVGCHSYLWDFTEGDWSVVADRLGMREKLPKEVRRSWEVLGTVSDTVAQRTGLRKDTVVTMGIHDSNASLLPYLISEQADFVLNSTGTWCVCMHPLSEVAFAPDEIGKVVFYNISALSNPVKTGIFLGGLEFDTYTQILKERTGVSDFPGFRHDVYRKVVEEKRLFILPSVVQGNGQFPDSKPRVYEDGMEYSLEQIQSGERLPAFFDDFHTAYAVLNVSLAIQTKVALERIGMRDGISLYTEGGFRRNPDYNRLISGFFPGSTLALTNIEEATSFGAAMLGKVAVEQTPIETLAGQFAIEKQPVTMTDFPGLTDYETAYMALL